MSQTSTIENWSIILRNPIQNLPHFTNKKVLCLYGESYGNSNVPDGSKIQTAQVIQYENGTVTVISGNRYKLGKINKNYEQVSNDPIGKIVSYLKESNKRSL